MRALKAGELPDTYFPAAVAAAVAAGAHKLVIPQGTYTFQGPPVTPASADPNVCTEQNYPACNPHWTLGTYPATPLTAPDSLVDLDIDLSNSTLNFTAPTTGIWIMNAARIRLENATLDWPTLHIASLGTIVADPTNPGHQALVLDPQYPAMDPLTGGPVQIEAVDPWDDSTDPTIAPGRFDLNATNADEVYFIFGNAPQPTYVGATAAGAETFSCSSCTFQNSPADSTCSMFNGCANFDGFAPGTRVIVRHYVYNGFGVLVNWSNDVDLENIHILTGPGMGIVEQNAGGFRGIKVAASSIKRAPGRLISTASDGINLSQFLGDVLIENDEIAYQGDDAVNVSASTQTLAVTSGNHFTLASSCSPQPADLALSGDVLAVFDANSNYLGNALTTVTAPCGTASMTLQLSCAPAPCAGLPPGFATAANSMIDLTQQPAARFLVQGNYFHENRGNGTDTGSPFGAIQGNTFYRNSMGPTSQATLGDLATATLTISGNTFN